MKIKFLGASGVQGIPVWNCDCDVCTSHNPKNKRLRPSLLIEAGGAIIVIDFGQDFRLQLLDNNIRHIDYALLTHVHGDHINGIEQLSAQDNLQLLTSANVYEELNNESGYVGWLQKRNPTIKVDKFERIRIGSLFVETVELLHKKDFGAKGVSCTGFIFDNGSFKFAYIVDYNDIIEKEKLRGLDLIISDANNWDNRGTGHVGVKGAIEAYKELQPKRMLLTHMNHRTKHEEVEEYAKKFGNIAPAYDGLEIEV